MTAPSSTSRTSASTSARCTPSTTCRSRLAENKIYGLLGRNGAGKTTLMQLLTGQDFASSGEIRLFGETPVENAAVLERTAFIKESQRYPEDFRAKHVLPHGAAGSSRTGIRPSPTS